MKVPWILENPKTSRVWLTVEVEALLAAGALFAEAHYCQYDQPWRKVTYFLCWHLPELPASVKQCHSFSGICSATHKKHINLQGTDSNGVFWTLRAQPYPKQLCKVIAQVIARQLLL
ncbi:unnamed protein product [Polarella glacialis]|uniref:Uncharacterized protein n=1 Tax=Polarella glacialis TaxID=89957 RepID=A0A813FFP4_POLGL|nr:unnamed protein product [Polarella glacialis]